MNKKLLFCIFALNGLFVQAQNISVVQSPAIGNLIEEHKKANTKIGTISGFRIQLFFDSGNNSKSNAEATKVKFSNQYPEVPVYLLYKEPNFKVRVGDFRTRSEARGFLKVISIEYPSAFVIKDEIKLPPLRQKGMKIE